MAFEKWEDLAAALGLVADSRDHRIAPVVGKKLGHHRRAAWRQLIERGHIEVGVIAHG
jgi:hypothetical protein